MNELLGIDTLTLRRECDAVRLALASAKEAQHCRLMERTWRKLAQQDKAAFYEAKALAYERRVLDLHTLSKALPA